MKITKFIIPLVLGLAGGLIAYFIADNFGSKTIQSTLQHQIVGPGAVRPVVHKSENDVLNDSAGPVDLRMAAKKTVLLRSSNSFLPYTDTLLQSTKRS